MKKLISIFLCIVIIASVMMPVCAEEKGFNKNLESETVQLFETIGIFDKNDEFVESETVYVSRGEFARLLVCTMGQKDMMVQGTDFEKLYKDVNAKTKYASEIIIASKLGLFGENLQDYFYPESLAEVSWAVKAMTRVLGYAPQLKSEPMIGYRLGLADKVVKNNAKYLSRQGAITLLKNALEIPVFKIEGVSGSHVIYNQTTDWTILNEYFDIYLKEGVLTADKWNAVKGERPKDNRICIDQNAYFVDDIETKDLVGLRCNFYIKKTDNEPVVVYIEKLMSKEIILYSKNMEYSYENNCYYMDKNGRKEKFQMNIETMVSYNGTPHFDKNKMHPLSGHVVLIDNDTDGIYDVCKVREYKNVVVKSCDINGKRIFDATSSSRDIVFDDYEDVLIYSEAGEEVEISEIPSNSVLTVYESIDKSRAELYITSRTMSRHLSKINISKDTIIIEDNEYKISDDSLFTATDLIVGQMYYFYINYWNEIVYVKDNSTYIALWFLDAYEDGVLDKKIQLRGLSETGEMMYVILAENLMWYDYTTGKTKIDASVALGRLKPAGSADKQMLKIALNDAGEVTEIVVAYDVTSRVALLSMAKDYPLIKMSYINAEWPDYALYRTDVSTGQKYAYFYGDNFGQWLFFDSSAVEFHVETNATVAEYDDEDMGVMTYRYSSTDQREINSFEVYMSSKDSVAAEYIVKDIEDPKETYFLNEGYYHTQGIVEDIENCLDADTGKVVNKLLICDRTGWKQEVYTISSDVIERQALLNAGAVLPTDKVCVESGDIISYYVDKNGKVKEIRLIYDAKGEIGTYPQTTMNVRVGCNYGDVIRSKNGFMEYNAYGGGLTSSTVLSANIGRYLIEYNKNTKKTRAITADEVYAGDNVVSISRYVSPFMVVVYRED